MRRGSFEPATGGDCFTGSLGGRGRLDGLGSVKVKAEPWPGTDSAQMRPPWASTSSRAMKSPSPSPSPLRAEWPR